MSTQRTTRVWGDTLVRKACEYRACGKRLWMAQRVRTGNFMAFEGEPIILSKQIEIGTNREEWLVDLSAEHWSKCAGAKMFRRRGRTHA